MFLVPTFSNLYRLNLMACKNPDCKNPDCPKKKEEDTSTKAFREFLEANPSRPEAKSYDV